MIKETQVHYVPGARNRYDPVNNVIVLDEHLLEYPQAHGLVLKHEFGHAHPENQTFTGFIKYEFMHDLRKTLHLYDEQKELQQYYKERKPPVHTFLKFEVGNTLRGFWCMLMLLLWPYKKLQQNSE